MSIKLPSVRELTRYVSPREIQKVRYEKFNMSKTDFDGFDKFFREDELFVKGHDKVTSSYRTYDVDDLPVSYSSIRDLDIVHYSSKQKGFVEGKTSPYIKMLKDDFIISEEDLINCKPAFGVQKLIDEKTEEGYTNTEIYNVLYSSVINGVIRTNLARPAFNMINEGYPLKAVVDTMEKAKLKRRNGTLKYTEGVFEFVKKFPHLKQVMVLVYRGEEFFDKEGAKAFEKIYDNVSDEKTAIQVIRDCRKSPKENLDCSDEKLLRVAYKIVRNQHDYKSEDAMLMGLLRRKNNSSAVYNVSKCLDEGMTSKEIIDKYYTPANGFNFRGRY